MLDHQPSLAPQQMNIVLFSQRDCRFCAEVRDHYLVPRQSSLRPQTVVSDVGIDLDTRIVWWDGTSVSEREFARMSGVRFAPTVGFFDGRGRELAPPIVGLSRDFFGSYLEQRIAAGLQALKRTGSR